MTHGKALAPACSPTTTVNATAATANLLVHIRGLIRPRDPLDTADIASK